MLKGKDKFNYDSNNNFYDNLNNANENNNYNDNYNDIIYYDKGELLDKNYKKYYNIDESLNLNYNFGKNFSSIETLYKDVHEKYNNEKEKEKENIFSDNISNLKEDDFEFDYLQNAIDFFVNVQNNQSIFEGNNYKYTRI
jgi:hypothetical protein